MKCQAITTRQNRPCAKPGTQHVWCETLEGVRLGQFDFCSEHATRSKYHKEGVLASLEGGMAYNSGLTRIREIGAAGGGAVEDPVALIGKARMRATDRGYGGCIQIWSNGEWFDIAWCGDTSDSHGNNIKGARVAEAIAALIGGKS